MAWHLLDPTVFPGPCVRVRLADAEGGRSDGALDGWALLDTGATHSVVDVERVVGPLRLRTLDLRTLALAGSAGVEAPVYAVAAAFPDHPVPDRSLRVSALRLPAPLLMLVGLDLLDGTRLAMELSGTDRWLRWEPLPLRDGDP